MKPLVTIIITVHNQEGFIADAWASVKAQTLPAWECVIVDDGSTDHSYENALALTAGDPRVQVITKPNGGSSSARNAGVRHAGRDSLYFVFLDGDDLLAPEFSAQLSAYLDAHPAAGVVTCGFIEVDKESKPLGAGIRTRYVPNALGFPRQLKPRENVTPFVAFFCATGQGPFAMMRRSVFEKTTGYDERLWPHEDTDIFCQIALRSEAHHLPLPLYWKRTHEMSIMHASTEHAVQEFRFFRADAYGIFRQKWDNYCAKDPRQQALLAHAKKYYYSRHRPFRDFKVALITLKLLTKDPTKARLDWFLCLCKSGFRGLFCGRES